METPALTTALVRAVALTTSQRKIKMSALPGNAGPRKQRRRWLETFGFRARHYRTGCRKSKEAVNRTGCTYSPLYPQISTNGVLCSSTVYIFVSFAFSLALLTYIALFRRLFQSIWCAWDKYTHGRQQKIFQEGATFYLPESKTNLVRNLNDKKDIDWMWCFFLLSQEISLLVLYYY